MYCVWANSKQGKTVCKYRGAKITPGKNNPVYSNPYVTSTATPSQLMYGKPQSQIGYQKHPNP